MNPELFAEANALWERADNIDNFVAENNRFPPTELRSVYQGMISLCEQLPEHPEPQTIDEIHEAELQRKLGVRINIYDHALSGKPVTLEETIKRVGLEPEEIDPAELRPWLLANRPAALEALDTQFRLASGKKKKRKPYMDIPVVQERFNTFARENIHRYHRNLIDLTVAQSTVGNELKGLAAEPTLKDRSYFSLHTRRMAYAISKICSEEESGDPFLNIYHLIRLNGHERNGHALQLILSQQSELPFYMKDSSTASGATEESLARHYERVIFEDVRKSPETQAILGIKDTFDEVYLFHTAKEAVTRYTAVMTNYSVALLADRSSGVPTDEDEIIRKMEQFAEVALDAREPYEYIGQQKDKYYPGGFYFDQEIDEIIYGSRAVQRALEIFEDNGFDYTDRGNRSLIDRTLLTGYYTPRGLVQNAMLTAQSNKPDQLPEEQEPGLMSLL